MCDKADKCMHEVRLIGKPYVIMHTHTHPHTYISMMLYALQHFEYWMYIKLHYTGGTYKKTSLPREIRPKLVKIINKNNCPEEIFIVDCFVSGVYNTCAVFWKVKHAYYITNDLCTGFENPVRRALSLWNSLDSSAKEQWQEKLQSFVWMTLLGCKIWVEVRGQNGEVLKELVKSLFLEQKKIQPTYQGKKYELNTKDTPNQNKIQ